MEVKFDIVRPNLYIVGDEVYFGIKRQDVIPVGRTVDEIIGKHIGVLKVNESDLELVELRRPVTTKENCSVALTKYLDVIEGRYELGEFKGITSNEAKLFDLGYVLAAQTIEEGGEDLNDWIALQRNLNNPDEFFDEYEKSELVLRLDREKTLREMKKLYDRLITKNGLNGLKVYLECGRVITGPYGYLVTTVLHLKHIYKDFVGCDACMANFMRPAIYGAYHHITVLGKETAPNNHVYDVTGSLCENNDKFAINRKLPEIIPSDILVIHDTGAHGFSMGFNYNGKLRSAELLLRQDGSVIKIRRAETVEDYFATLDFDDLKNFE